MTPPKPELPHFNLLDAFPQCPHRFLALLRRHNLSLTELARRTGIARPTLDRLLNGVGNPLLSTVDTVARYFGMSIYDLLGPPTELRGDLTLRPEDPLLAPPPAKDWNALWIYEQLVAMCDGGELERQVAALAYTLPAESAAEAINRAVLDVFQSRQAWIDADHLDRVEELEEELTRRYALSPVGHLQDPTPVRVIDLSEEYHELVRLFAIAAAAAQLTRELMGHYKTLGVGDGYSTAIWGMFLRRGTLTGAGLVPMVITPDHSQNFLNGNSAIAALTRNHHGYRVDSVIGIGQMRNRLRKIDHAVSSVGPGISEPLGRLTRLVQNSEHDVVDFYQRLAARGVVGDQMYNFIDEDGVVVDMPDITGDLTRLDTRTLRGPGPKPLVYAAPVSELSAIAERGVSMAHTHHVNRARVLHTALCAKHPAYNLVVVTRGIAEAMLALPMVVPGQGGAKSAPSAAKPSRVKSTTPKKGKRTRRRA